MKSSDFKSIFHGTPKCQGDARTFGFLVSFLFSFDFHFLFRRVGRRRPTNLSLNLRKSRSLRPLLRFRPLLPRPLCRFQVLRHDFYSRFFPAVATRHRRGFFLMFALCRTSNPGPSKRQPSHPLHARFADICYAFFLLSLAALCSPLLFLTPF